jgi:ATP-dependent DNA ligase
MIRSPLMERRALLRKLVKQDPRSPIQFSDHLEGDGARFWDQIGMAALNSPVRLT